MCLPLLEESYVIEDELVELKKQKLKRGFFGGLDDDEARSRCLRPFLLMNRLCEIKQILQGRFDPVYTGDGSIETVGDYLEYLLRLGIKGRLVPSDDEAEKEQDQSDAA